MANILVNIETGIEVAAKDILSWVTKGEKVVATAPQVIAALGVLLGAVDAAVTNTASAAQNAGLNITLDQAAWTSIQQVWPDVKAFGQSLGIKF